ncbi:anti-sigma regulatory factor [Ramlibacter ginsenosidimutans]|uniref:Anti-sigma regulatory factor n=1 Tax=Ramlibacter ginsenosidimutans TaxID=502333 RepID=A0A934TRJ1_9BURK|nr:anti-sigma regulatory factor [Ramlibacter ginsenosidimutans]MBK6006221.1 anti-sigma regulatory factor [Ramlibacter ginsenosidimutans]
MIAGTFHTAFPIGDASRVGEARRHAADLADACALDEVEAGRLALVVTELATNLLKHAEQGRLWLSARRERREVEVIAVDCGPGIRDLQRCLDDGYSTAGSPGTGLGAVRRLADHFDLHSSVPGGTVVVARVRAAGAPDSEAATCVGAVSLCAPGESVCGDAWCFALAGDRCALIVADGLGHGPDAAEAAAAALESFAQDPMDSPRTVMERTHQALRGTRGAAVLVLQAAVDEDVVRSAGAGNVIARLVSGVSDRTIMSQNGTAGVAMRTPQETTTPWPDHALLVACSDGIETRWMPETLAPLLGRDPTLAAAVLMRDHIRGRDDATVAVLRRRH